MGWGYAVAVAVRRPSSQLGEIIRRHRELNRLTLRQFAALAGISNPYLSQIERGLRAPSDEVVHAIARSLQTTPDHLYEQAGMAREPDLAGDGGARLEAVLGDDPALSPRQRRVLLEVYDGLANTSAPRPPAKPSRGSNSDSSGSVNSRPGTR